MRKRILFVCVHNAARSQMAEAYCEHYGGDSFIAESAGLEPGDINPYVVRAMQEKGIDISCKKSDLIDDFLAEGRKYDYLVTVCSESEAESCPMFPGMDKDDRLHWSFANPSNFVGTDDEIMAQVREVREQIAAKIQEFLAAASD